MSSTANWSYTAPITFWKRLGDNEYGDSLGFSEPVVIMGDYQGGLSRKLGALGFDKAVKNTIWTEFAGADTGDYILIGESTEPDPLAAGADEVMQAINYGDTLERASEDFVIITGF